MTQEELHIKIKHIATYHSELGEGTSGYDLSNEKFDELFSLINKYVAEVIGEDEEFGGIAPHPMIPAPGNAFWNKRNELRVEQRKRAGL